MVIEINDSNMVNFSNFKELILILIKMVIFLNYLFKLSV